MRSALAKKDHKALRSLAASDRAAALPPSVLFLLSRGLYRAKATKERLALMRRALRRHPGDFWVNLHLANALADLNPPALDEAIRYLTAARALRQSPKHARR